MTRDSDASAPFVRSGGRIAWDASRLLEATVTRIMTAAQDVAPVLLAGEAGLVDPDDHLRAHYAVGNSADVDPVAWEAGRGVGRAEILQHVQSRLQALIGDAGRFEPTDALEQLLTEVQDLMHERVEPTQSVDAP